MNRIAEGDRFRTRGSAKQRTCGAHLTVSLRWAQCRSEGCFAEGRPLILLDFFGTSAAPTAGAKILLSANA